MKLLTKMLNSVGDIIDPWSTPDFIGIINSGSCPHCDEWFRNIVLRRLHDGVSRPWLLS